MGSQRGLPLFSVVAGVTLFVVPVLYAWVEERRLA